MTIFEEERIEKIEADFRETIKGDWGTEWWNPIKTAFQSAEPSFPGATFHFAKKETDLK